MNRDDSAKEPQATQRELYRQALVCIDEQRYDEALELLDKYLTEHRRDVEALYARAVTNVATGAYRKAGCDLLKTLALDSDRAEAWKHLGYVQFMLGKEESALKTIEKGLELTPDNAALYCVLGDIYLDLAEFDKAKEAIDKACALEPNNPEPHSKLAMYYVARGDMQGLQREYELLQQLDEALAEQLRTLFFEMP